MPHAIQVAVARLATTTNVPPADLLWAAGTLARSPDGHHRPVSETAVIAALQQAAAHGPATFSTAVAELRARVHSDSTPSTEANMTTSAERPAD